MMMIMMIIVSQQCFSKGMKLCMLIMMSMMIGVADNVDSYAPAMININDYS